MAMKINENQVALRTKAGSFPTLEDYFNGRIVKQGPIREVNSFTLAAPATFTPIAAAAFTATNISVGIGSTFNGGVFAVAAGGALGSAYTQTASDTYGNILNMFPIQDAVTNNQIVDSSGRAVFGLLHCALATVDGAAITGANLQISFVVLSGTSTLTAASLQAGSYGFRENRVYLRRSQPVISFEGGNNDADILEPAVSTVAIRQFVITANFVASEVLTLGTGAGATAGAATVTGDVITLDASALLFNANNKVEVFHNGILQVKGSDVSWSSASAAFFALPLYVGDNLTFVVRS